MLDVPPFTYDRLKDASIPIYVTEGSKKADAGVSRGLACISLSGVWGGTRKGDDGKLHLLPDWDDITLEDRLIYLVFDSDVTEKMEVARALAAQHITREPLMQSQDGMHLPAVTPLTPAEMEQLRELETIIDRNLKAFVAVGEALREVRDSRLYRTHHQTFEAYCRDRWGLTRSHAYRTIAAAGVVENIRAVSPIGDNQLPLPANEAQVRPLTAFRPHQQVAIWRSVVETTNGPVTARHVEWAAHAAREQFGPDDVLATANAIAAKAALPSLAVRTFLDLFHYTRNRLAALHRDLAAGASLPTMDGWDRGRLAVVLSEIDQLVADIRARLSEDTPRLPK